MSQRQDKKDVILLTPTYTITNIIKTDEATTIMVAKNVKRRKPSNISRINNPKECPPRGIINIKYIFSPMDFANFQVHCMVPKWP